MGFAQKPLQLNTASRTAITLAARSYSYFQTVEPQSCSLLTPEAEIPAERAAAIVASRLYEHMQSVEHNLSCIVVEPMYTKSGTLSYLAEQIVRSFLGAYVSLTLTISAESPNSQRVLKKRQKKKAIIQQGRLLQVPIRPMTPPTTITMKTMKQ